MMPPDTHDFDKRLLARLLAKSKVEVRPTTPLWVVVILTVGTVIYLLGRVGGWW